MTLVGGACQEQGHLSVKGGGQTAHLLAILIADEFLDVLPAFESVGSKPVV